MKKFSLTAAEVENLQRELYSLRDEELELEASFIAEDWLSWTAARFVLDVALLEELRRVPIQLRKQLGWLLAVCVLGRRTFSIEDKRAGVGQCSIYLSLALDFSGLSRRNGLIMIVVGDTKENKCS